MNLERIKKTLIDEEKFVSHAYKDHLGYLTIGIGRLIDKRKGGGISRSEADYLLENDILGAFTALKNSLPWFKDAPEIVQEALILMAFQMGVEGLLKFKNTLSLIERGKFETAADNALKSNWAKQTPARAHRVTDLIRKGE